MRAAEPRDLWVAIATDSVFRGPSVLLADSHALAGSVGDGRSVACPRRRAHTSISSPGRHRPSVGSWGRATALEIPFVFGTVNNPVVQQFSGGGDDALRLSEGMRQAWISFARTGSPSADLVGEWPVWDPIRRPTMVFGPWPGCEGMWRAVDAPRDEELLALLTALPPSTIGSELAP